MALYQWLPDRLSDTAVITASRRLARELQNEYNLRQQRNGLFAWNTPAIMFVADWMAHTLDTGGDSPAALRVSTSVTSRIWERAVREVLTEASPPNPAIASQCRQTWDRLREWQVPLAEVERRAFGAEQRMFAAAAKRVRDLMDNQGWLDDASLMDATSEAILAGAAATPACAILAGFDRITPSLQKMIDALGSAGTQVDVADAASPSRDCRVAAFRSADAELRAAGFWARTMKVADAACRIAIIHPDLERDAEHVGRQVREGFVPGWQYGSDRHRDAVNVSYGRTLSAYPAIAVALLILRWAASRLSSRDVSILLRSPNLIGSALGGRSGLERQFRRLPDRQWDVAQMLGALRIDMDSTSTAEWGRAWQAVVDKRKRWRTPRGAAQWAEIFDEILTLVGWPGTVALGSGEFQLVNRWRGLLNDFAQLEILEHRLNFKEAVAGIGQLAAETLYQPESAAASLPVLGVLEAAGLEFDAIWVCGFDASRWPAVGRPLTLLSRPLQREYAMPDATVDDTLAFSRRVLARLLASSRDVRFSWALSQDGAAQQLTPLAAEYDCVDVEAAGLDPGRHALTLAHAAQTGRPASDPAPPVRNNDRVSGGADTVQRQTSEGFAAFAYGRLHLSELQSFQIGLSASARGRLLHRALQSLYKPLPTQQDIVSWNSQERSERIRSAADFATARLLHYASPALTRIIALEQRRMSRILHAWLEVEAGRDEFSVCAVEEALDFQRYDVRLGLRVDRVDETASGDLAVIDYKTGKEKTLLNRAGDINILQLVVYALALNKAVGQLAIVNLDSRGVSIRSTTDLADWDERFAAWSKSVDEAVLGIARGDIGVNIALNTEQGRTLNVLSRFEELRRE